MTIEIDSLFDLDPATVQARQDWLAQLLQEYNPVFYLKRGVIFDYVLAPMAMFDTLHSQFWTRVQDSSSLLAISENPDLADPALVAKVAANHLVQPLAGQQASGSVTIILAALSPTVIPAGAVFVANGQQFVTQSAFAARDSVALVQQPADRLLTLLSDGTYAFVIDVVAVNEGTAGQLTTNAVVAPASAIPNFVKAYVTEDFTGGYSAESVQSLITRLLPGVAARALSGPVNMTAFLMNNTEFEHFVADSVIGMGKTEMLRDKHSIFPGATGGKVDWYVKTQGLPQSLALTKTATLVEQTLDGYGVWQFSLGRDDAPGFYDIPQILLPNSGNSLGSFAIVGEQRGLDLSPLQNDGFLPDVANVLEGAYTRFQTATVRFADTVTPTAGMTPFSTQQDYAVTVRAMPLLADIQEVTAALKFRNPMGDCLVRAPVPCFVKLSFVIRLVQGQLAPDLPTLIGELAQAVNSIGFTGCLPASVLTDIVQGSLTGGSYVDSIDILGRIQRPDGSFRLLRSIQTLEIPDEAASLVSHRTTTFFLDPRDVAITVLPIGGS